MGWFPVFGAGVGGGFSSVLQPEAPAGWEVKVFPMGLAGTAEVLPAGPHSDEPAGQGWAMAEVGSHSEPLGLQERSRTTTPPSLTVPRPGWEMHAQLKMNLPQPELNGFGQVSYETEKRKEKNLALNVDHLFCRGKTHKTTKYVESQGWRGPGSGVGLGRWRSAGEGAGGAGERLAWAGSRV